MNEDVPTFDVEQINKITMISVNKILDSFTSLTNKGFTAKIRALCYSINAFV